MKHLTIGASEKTFKVLFESIRDNLTFTKSDSNSFGVFSASYSLQAHLEGGNVDLCDDPDYVDGIINIKELDIKWDQLNLDLGLDIEKCCLPRFCILPKPFGGCWIRSPKLCIFDESPDINIPLHLEGLITSEVSILASLKTEYDTNGDPEIPNYWKIFLDPQSVDLDVFDIADSVGDLLENTASNLIDNLIPFGWARKLFKAILGPIIDVLRKILDFGDDIQEWLSDLLSVSFGISNFILELVTDHFASKYPLYQIEDPYPILEKVANPNSNLLPSIIPVKIPILELIVYNNSKEMIVEGNIGVSL